ncbi:MAG: SDR family NAD(P)-dependent oxidoreductase [Planctomycetota bacterium]
MTEPAPISDADLQACLRVLAALHQVDLDDPVFEQVEQAAAHLRKSAKRRRRRARDQAARRNNRAIVEAAGMFRHKATDPFLVGQEPPVPLTPPAPGECDESNENAVGELSRDRTCYTCKRAYRIVDAWYHLLCPACAQQHREKRMATADLHGRRAIVTGGRIKIGLHVALRLLRAGARVAVTTRFPVDAARRFGREDDAADWQDRLQVFGLDFLRLDDVLHFVEQQAEAGEPLDILVNNAAQTVRRPAEWHHDVLRAEALPLQPHEQRLLGDARFAQPDAQRRLQSITASGGNGNAETGMAAALALFPQGLVDHEGLQIDRRTSNSWVEALEDVTPLELVETTIINQLAPFLLCSRLKPLMERSRFADRYIVNVSAMEGKFSYTAKSSKHPHTNMAKAALNMLTRTSAADYLRSGIHMTAVDTGWITQENPQPLREMAESMGFQPPLDLVDGASRVLDPIFSGVNATRPEDRLAGVFLKDYRPTDW